MYKQHVQLPGVSHSKQPRTPDRLIVGRARTRCAITTQLHLEQLAVRPVGSCFSERFTFTAGAGVLSYVVTPTGAVKATQQLKGSFWALSREVLGAEYGAYSALH
jgi:hypothetical protein